MKLVNIKFTDKQLEKIADWLGDMALIAIASVVIPSFFDKFDIYLVISGFIFALLGWSGSLMILKQLNKNYE